MQYTYWPKCQEGKVIRQQNFDKLIEYNMKNIFLKKSLTEYGVEANPINFSKKSNWAYLLINSLKFYTNCLYCMLSWGLSKYIESKLQTLPFTSNKTFLKNEKWSRTSLSASFSAWFLKKTFSLVIFYYWPNFIFCLILCICNYLLTRCDVVNFEINLIFLIKPFFPHDLKIEKKIKYFENEKSF